MPNKHAALKQLRKDRKRRARNQAATSELRTLTKQVIVLLRAEKREETGTLLRKISSAYDRAAQKGIIHRNTAARYKSRLTKRIKTAAA